MSRIKALLGKATVPAYKSHISGSADYHVVYLSVQELLNNAGFVLKEHRIVNRDVGDTLAVRMYIPFI